LQDTGSAAADSGQADVSGDLSAAFPVGVFAGSPRVRRSGLHAAVDANGAHGKGLFKTAALATRAPL